MGIKQLFSIIKEEAPDAFKEGEIKNQFGRKVAIVSTSYALSKYVEDLHWLCSKDAYVVPSNSGLVRL